METASEAAWRPQDPLRSPERVSKAIERQKNHRRGLERVPEAI